MFVDAAAIVAILSDEGEARRCSQAMMEAPSAITSPIAIWEAAVAPAGPDKLARPLETAERLVLRFLDDRGIAIRDLPEAPEATSLSLEAALRFRSGTMRLNLADCSHYACARHYRVPILSTAGEFRSTDIETVP